MGQGIIIFGLAEGVAWLQAFLLGLLLIGLNTNNINLLFCGLQKRRQISRVWRSVSIKLVVWWGLGVLRNIGGWRGGRWKMEDGAAAVTELRSS